MLVEAENDGNEGDDTERNVIYRYFCISILCYFVVYCADKQDLKV